jgi:uncharacterized protein (TIGR03086 family)
VSANLRDYVVALFGFDHVIRGVADDQWDNPSPCSDWNARDVAGHAMGVVVNIAARAGGGAQVDIFDNPGAIAGADPYASFREARNTLLETLDGRGVLQRPITSSLGTLSVDGFLGEMMPDILIHTWDLARATGGDERLDSRLVSLARSTLERRGEGALRAPGRFDAVADQSAADPQSALLAFTGRQG